MGDNTNKDNRQDSSILAQAENIATLKERVATNTKGRAALYRELKDLSLKVDAHIGESKRYFESNNRIGGDSVHEGHHRFIAELLQAKKDRHDLLKKLKEDLLSKSALGFISLIVAGSTYIYHTLSKLLGGG